MLIHEQRYLSNGRRLTYGVLSLGIPEKIKAIQEEIHRTQINKATEFHIGILKAKISKLRRELDENRHGKNVSTGKGNEGFNVRKSGDASVVLVGLPSVGKSTLLNALTNANSRTASYQFTTLTAVPGMMDYNGSKIQILDLPGIVEGASKGRGLGRKVLSVARNADLVLMVLDVFHPELLNILENELNEVGIRINKKLPEVFIEKAHYGGLSIHNQVSSIPDQLVKEVLKIHGINSGRIIIKEPNLTVEQLIDSVSGNRIYLPSLVVLNKIDLVDSKFISKIDRTMQNFIAISADRKINIDYLKRSIYDKLAFIRIFLKPRGNKIDYEEPLIMNQNCTIRDVCLKIHRNFVKDFKYAYVWGKSVKFSSQKVGLDHILQDKDILRIILR
jgi:small GTP-binding protein